MLVVCVTVGLSLLQPAYAQSVWSDPYPLYQSDYLVIHPIIVADVTGTLHVFWIENDIANAIIPAVFHTVMVDSKWSTPVSIILSTSGDPITGFRVIADRNGSIHAIWHGSNHNLFYSSVEAAKAGDPRSWTTPVILGTTFTYPGITTDKNNAIIVAYPADAADGIYVIASRDSGHTWDVPLLVARASVPDSGVDYTSIVVDTEGNLHVAWSEFRLPDGWPPTGVFVTSSKDNGLSWTSPVQLAGEGYDQINLAVNQNGVVYAFWNGMIGLGGRYISTSLDRGQTWSEPVSVVPLGIGGTSGYPHVVFDSLDRGHLITSLDWHGGIQYIQQDSYAWTPGVEISSSIDYRSYAYTSLEFPWLCITQGNILHVVYEAGLEDIFYQQAILDAPTTQSVPFIPVSTADIEPLSEHTPLSPMDANSYPDINDEGMVTSSISQPLNLAALCVLGLIMSAYLAKKWRQLR